MNHLFSKNRNAQSSIESIQENTLKALLLKLKNKNELPSLIPKFLLMEGEKLNFYSLENYFSKFESFLEQQKKIRCFSFSEIFSFFNQLINGLVFLEINGLVIKITASSFFISQNKELKCMELYVLTKEKTKEAISNFGILILQIFTFMSWEKMNFLIKNERRSIDKIIENMNKKYSRSIAKNECIRLEILIKTLKRIFASPSQEDFGFLELFFDVLKTKKVGYLEQIILMKENNSNTCFYFKFIF